MSLGSDFFLFLFLKFWLEVFLNAAFRKYERGHTVLWKVQRRQMPSKALGPKGARPLQQCLVRMLSAWVEGLQSLVLRQDGGPGSVRMRGSKRTLCSPANLCASRLSAPVCACCWRSGSSSLPPGRPASVRPSFGPSCAHADRSLARAWRTPERAGLLTLREHGGVQCPLQRKR